MKNTEAPQPRFVVDVLTNGEGWVIVDRYWEYKMTGPYRSKAEAESRCAQFNADQPVDLYAEGAV